MIIRFFPQNFNFPLKIPSSHTSLTCSLFPSSQLEIPSFHLLLVNKTSPPNRKGSGQHALLTTRSQADDEAFQGKYNYTDNVHNVLSVLRVQLPRWDISKICVLNVLSELQGQLPRANIGVHNVLYSLYCRVTLVNIPETRCTKCTLCTAGSAATCRFTLK